MVGDTQQPPGDVAAHDDLRMHDQADRAAGPGELGGDGVDEEGHVVGDDLDDGAPRAPSVDRRLRRQHPQVHRALGPLCRQAVVRERGTVEVLRVPLAPGPRP